MTRSGLTRPFAEQDDRAIAHSLAGLDSFGEVDFFALGVRHRMTPPIQLGISVGITDLQVLDNEGNGGEGGIRTLGTGVSPYNGLAILSPRRRRHAIPITYIRTRPLQVTSCDLSRQFRDTVQDIELSYADGRSSESISSVGGDAASGGLLSLPRLTRFNLPNNLQMGASAFKWGDPASFGCIYSPVCSPKAWAFVAI